MRERVVGKSVLRAPERLLERNQCCVRVHGKTQQGDLKDCGTQPPPGGKGLLTAHLEDTNLISYRLTAQAPACCPWPIPPCLLSWFLLVNPSALGKKPWTVFPTTSPPPKWSWFPFWPPAKHLQSQLQPAQLPLRPLIYSTCQAACKAEQQPTTRDTCWTGKQVGVMVQG